MSGAARWRRGAGAVDVAHRAAGAAAAARAVRKPLTLVRCGGVEVGVGLGRGRGGGLGEGREKRVNRVVMGRSGMGWVVQGGWEAARLRISRERALEAAVLGVIVHAGVHLPGVRRLVEIGGDEGAWIAAQRQCMHVAAILPARAVAARCAGAIIPSDLQQVLCRVAAIQKRGDIARLALAVGTCDDPALFPVVVKPADYLAGCRGVDGESTPRCCQLVGNCYSHAVALVLCLEGSVALPLAGFAQREARLQRRGPRDVVGVPLTPTTAFGPGTVLAVLGRGAVAAARGEGWGAEKDESEHGLDTPVVVRGGPAI